MLLRACTRSAAEGDCVDANAPQTEPPRAVVILSWEADGTVRIQVGLRDPPRWRTRVLRFSAGDEPVEIGTAVGLAAGTLATSPNLGEDAGETPDPPPEVAAALEPSPSATLLPAAPAPSPPAGAPPPPRAAGEPKETPAVNLRRPSVDLGMLLATGVEPNAPRVGSRLGTTAWVADAWSLSLRADLGWVLRTPAGVRYRIATFAIAPGYSWSHRELRVTVRPQLAVDRLDVSARDGNTGERDRAGRWLGSGGLGAEIDWPCRSWVRLVVASDAVWGFGATDVIVDDRLRPAPSHVHGAGVLALRVGGPCPPP